MPKPETWADLTKPIYKDQIVMPNPASSGTGYLDVAAWLQIMGEAGRRWKFMDALHQNIAQYMHSGSEPCVQAATGEFVIGISFDYPRHRREDQGRADRAHRSRRKASAGRSRPSAIMKGTKNLEAAKKLADWVVDQGGQRALRARTSRSSPSPASPSRANYPADGEKLLVKNDFEWVAKNRDRILAEWTKRYDGKSAPKK